MTPVQNTPSSSVDDPNEEDPIRQWLLDEQARYEARLVARLAARVRAGQRVWWVLTVRGWWVL